MIYDLLEKSSGHLELREDPEQGITVAGLRSIKVHIFLSPTKATITTVFVEDMLSPEYGYILKY